jgi:phage-related protein
VSDEEARSLVRLFGLDECYSLAWTLVHLLEAGFLLRKLQRGDVLSMPHARPMPAIGPRCYELRVNDEKKTWRIIYRLDQDAIVICEVFEKKTHRTPKSVIDVCQQRLGRYADDWSHDSIIAQKPFAMHLHRCVRTFHEGCSGEKTHRLPDGLSWLM